MEIRALTGFDKKTREQYGRSYTPLNGTDTLLGMGNMYTPTMTVSEQASALEKFGVSPTKTATEEIVATDTFSAEANPSVSQSSPNVKTNFFEKYKKPLMVAGGVVAAFLIYKQIKK